MLPDGRIIIEVGLNETATKDQARHVPYGVDEVVAAGLACAEAGASVLHFHARDDDGGQLWDSAATYRAEMEAIGARTDVLMYPSYNRSFAAIWDLLDDPPDGAAMFLTPFDVFQGVGQVRWDEAERRFAEIHFDTMADTPGATRPAELDEMLHRGQVPTICAQDLGDIRWTRHAIEAGILHAPVSLKVFVIDQFLKGAEPTPGGVDAILSHVNAEIEPMIVPALMRTAARCEAVLRRAIARGSHIRVGLGDNPDAFPDLTNADLVRWAVRLIGDAGLQPATADDVRTHFRGAQPG